MKKKLVFAVALTIAASAALFSEEGISPENSLSYETRVTFGFEYGNFFDTRTDEGADIETCMRSPGLNLSLYHLWDNIGFFYNFSFLFPNNVNSNINGYEYFFLFNFIVGPAFKIPLGDRFSLIGGTGFSLSPVFGEINDASLVLVNMGIGGDIGFSVKIDKMAYVEIGSLLSYHFGNVTRTGTGRYEEDEEGDRNEIKDTGWSSNYNMGGVRPYVRIVMKF
jgi:hypothetical protein